MSDQQTIDITGCDFVAIPAKDADRARAFYGETLGLRPDEHSQYEFWAGDTCLGIWEPDKLGATFSPQHNGHVALHVDDVPAARAVLEAKGVTFTAPTIETPVCRMALFQDSEGNDLMLHGRFAPYE